MREGEGEEEVVRIEVGACGARDAIPEEAMHGFAAK